MRPHRPGSRTPILLLAAAALAATATVAARGTSASTPAGNAEVSEESKATLRLLWELREPLANVHGLPGGCPVEGRGVVAVAEAFAAAGLPHPERFDADGWGNPLRFWCAGDAWAAISRGADGLPDANDGALPDVEAAGDDMIVFGDGRMVLPGALDAAIESGKQKRTMADMRSIATVFEVYRIDHAALPGEPYGGWQAVEGLRSRVQPVYIRELPVLDAWGNPFVYRVEGERYVIVSGGRDGTTSADWWTVAAGGPVESPDADLVLADGAFVQYVE